MTDKFTEDRQTQTDKKLSRTNLGTMIEDLEHVLDLEDVWVRRIVLPLGGG